MPSAADLVDFYDDSYSRDGDEAQRYGQWRALGAVGKADHVVALCRRGGLTPGTVADIGCGDGALLSELHRRGFGAELDGFEITEAAVRLARQRPGLHAVTGFDGQRLPVAGKRYDLGILSHVLEHVTEPVALLAEVGRCCAAVIVEVPLEANLSARRRSKQPGAAEVGHLQRFDRAAVASIVELAHLRVVSELDDPLPLAVHRFFAATGPARARAAVKWAARATAARAVPNLARRCFTVHHSVLCLPSGR